MYPNVSKCIQTYPNVSKNIQEYPNLLQRNTKVINGSYYNIRIAILTIMRITTEGENIDL